MQSVDTVLIDYDDDDGNQFSRQFVLTGNSSTGTVAWVHEPIVPRGQIREIQPGVQSLAKLRQKIALADAYQREHEAAQQLATQLQQSQRENQKLIGTRSNVEIAGAFRLLAREAETLHNQLHGIRIVLDKDLDKEGVAASEYPLRQMNFAREDRSKWTEDHVKLFLFQHDYAWHRSYVMQERIDTGFTSEVITYPLSLDDSNTTKQVIKMLDDHAKKLRDQAAKLAELP